MTIPAPPWQKATRSRPAKPPLGRDAIVTAALTVLDAEGLAGLTMRRVAQELDTGPASLYAHVSNRDELEELVFDRILGEVPVSEPDAGRWDEQLRQLMRDIVAVLGRHPGSARLVMGRIPLTPNALVMEEAILALLRRGRLPERTVALGIDLLFLYATATAFEDAAGAAYWGDEEAAGKRSAQVRGYLESLPEDRFPNLVAMAGPLLAGDGTARFEFGLDILIRGLIGSAP
jgi:AcrR family transcriptional regulator